MNSSFGRRLTIVPLVLLALLVTVYGGYLWMIQELFFEPRDWLITIGLATFGFALVSIPINFAYDFYMMYCVIPHLDPVLEPNRHWYIERYGDDLFHRTHRLIFYSASASWPLLNRRLQPEYDLTQLSSSMRTLLRAAFYSQVALGLSMLVSGVTLKCAEMLGHL